MISDSPSCLPPSGGSASAKARRKRIAALAAGIGHSEIGPGRTDRGLSVPGNGGFTLIEMVVVICVVLILAALLIPVARKSMDTSRQMQCVSNLRQMTQSIQQYASDHTTRLPPEYIWMNCLAPYLGLSATASNLDTLGVFRCPAGWTSGAQTAAGSNQATYWYNCHSTPFAETPANSPTGTNTFYYSSPPLALFVHPADAIILTCWWYYLWSGNWTSPPGDTHSNGRPVSYLDGHVVYQTTPAYYQYGAPPMSAIAVY